MFGRRGEGVWFSGRMSDEAGRLFKVASLDLAELYRTVYGHNPASVSQADVIEYLLRGAAGTLAILKRVKG